MYAYTARRLVSLRTSSPAYKSRSLHILSTRQPKSSQSRPPRVQLPSCLKPLVRFASKSASERDSGDALSSIVSTVVDAADYSPALNGASEVSSEAVNELERHGNTLQESTSDVMVEPAIAEQDGLANASRKDQNANLVGQSHDQQEADQRSLNSLITRSQSLLGVADLDLYGMPVDPIPPLPPRPEYPVFQISDNDLQKYVIPLYSRKWYINYGFKKVTTHIKTIRYKAAMLRRIYNFPTSAATMNFVTEVASLSQVESHYPNIAFENKQACISTCTYTAFQKTSNGSSEYIVDHKRPCITLRDVRFAILVEDTFSRHFLASGHGLQGKTVFHPAHERPQTLAVIEKMGRRSREFGGVANNDKKPMSEPAMRSDDALLGTERSTKLPPAGKLCQHCKLEGHWSMNCPMRRDPKSQVLRTPLHENPTAPSRPCRLCGGNHWDLDCALLRANPPLLSLRKEDRDRHQEIVER